MKHRMAGSSGKLLVTYITLCAGIILSTIVFFYVRNVKEMSVQNEFDIIAADRANIIKYGADDILELLKSVGYFYAGSQSVERDEFHEFTKNILDEHPEIYEFRWLRRVSDAGRREFEAEVSAQGYGDFYIKDIDAGGSMVRAGRRDEYFPIRYMEPYDEMNIAVWGVDPFHLAGIREAIERARDTGEPAISSEVWFLGEARFKNANRVFLPVYRSGTPRLTIEERRKNIEGLVVILFNMERMCEILLKNLRGKGIDTYIYDESFPAGSRLICFDYSHTRKGSVAPLFGEEQLEGYDGIFWKGSFPLADSTLTIICRPAPVFFEKHKSDQPWVIFGMCMLVTAVLTMYLKSSVQRTAVIEALVKERTAELQTAYEKLKAAQEQLVQAYKMASIGLLAGGVAHEINNPLTGVLNNAQLIKMMISEKKELNADIFRELIDNIEESARRCVKITSSLLSFLHPSQGAYQDISLNDMIGKVLFLVEHDLKLQNISLDAGLEPGLPLIKGDPQLLQQAIFDLINNAKWAIQKGSERKEGAIKIKSWYLPADKSVNISVSDTGIGIPAEDINRIFEPFFTTKDVGEGSGLGLYLVYKIIRSHKGAIEAESEPGRGTTFKIKFPVS